MDCCLVGPHQHGVREGNHMREMAIQSTKHWVSIHLRCWRREKSAAPLFVLASDLYSTGLLIKVLLAFYIRTRLGWSSISNIPARACQLDFQGVVESFLCPTFHFYFAMSILSHSSVSSLSLLVKSSPHFATDMLLSLCSSVVCGFPLNSAFLVKYLQFLTLLHVLCGPKESFACSLKHLLKWIGHRATEMDRFSLVKKNRWFLLNLNLLLISFHFM